MFRKTLLFYIVGIYSASAIVYMTFQHTQDETQKQYDLIEYVYNGKKPLVGTLRERRRAREAQVQAQRQLELDRRNEKWNQIPKSK